MQFFEENGFAYYKHEPSNFNNTIVVLPPGAFNAEFFLPFLANLDNYSTRIFLLNFKNRVNYDPKIKYSFSKDSHYVNSFIREIVRDKCSLMGISTTSAVATEAVKQDPDLYDKLALISVGEFIKPILKPVCRGILNLGKTSTISPFYMKLLQFKYESYKREPFVDPRILTQLYLSAVNYKFSFERALEIPAYFFHFKYDSLIDLSSVSKFKEFLPNHIEGYIHAKHEPSDEVAEIVSHVVLPKVANFINN